MSTRLRLPRLWRGLGHTWLLAVSVLSLAQIPQPVAIDNADKWTHWLAWMLMMAWFGSAWPAAQTRCFFFLLAVSTALELLQDLLPWRFMDVYDMLANLAGLLCGGVLLKTRFKRILPWFDDVVANRLNTPHV